MNHGKFIIAANHIGNFKDIPVRTVEAIKNTKHIFCDFLDNFHSEVIEPNFIDTSNKNIIPIQGRSGFENLAKSVLENGDDIVFICDNGLPGFADSGLDLVKFISSHGFVVEIIPGPSILPTALAISGLSDRESDLYFMQLFSCTPEERKAKVSTLQGFHVTTVILDFQENIEDVILFAKEALSDDRELAICINIGMDTQRIIRSTVFGIAGQKLNLGKSLTEEHLHVTLVIEAPAESDIK